MITSEIDNLAFTKGAARQQKAEMPASIPKKTAKSQKGAKKREATKIEGSNEQTEAVP